MIKRILLFLLITLLALVGVLLFNAFRFKSKQLSVDTIPAPEITDVAIQRFQEAIKYKTISHSDPALLDSSAFFGFHRFLQNSYPKVHATLLRERVAGYSLLYKWPGKNPSLPAIILMAHQDVVPIEDATKSMWSVDPFAGERKDNFIWGRGTADDKVNLVSIMEAAEALLGENYQPERTIYFAFGHDEELGGIGAQTIVALLKSRQIRADMVLDEGGYITDKEVPFMSNPVALIGTSEKGYFSLEVTAEKNGGHSSVPESETSIDILTKALVRLREHPFEADFNASTQGFLDHIGPEMPFTMKIVFANQWLFKRVIVGIYEKSAKTNAFVRTTIAPTILQAGIKDNVIPTIAKAVVNFRLLPGDSSAKVIDHVKKAINDERVTVTQFNSFKGEPTAITSETGFAYSKVDKIVRRSFPGTITTPFLMLGGTDSRHFSEISDGILKFSPITDPIGFHGIDERVTIKSYQSDIWFYLQLMRDTK